MHRLIKKSNQTLNNCKINAGGQNQTPFLKTNITFLFPIYQMTFTIPRARRPQKFKFVALSIVDIGHIL